MPSTVDTAPREPIFAEPTSPPTASADLLEEADRVMARLVEDFPKSDRQSGTKGAVLEMAW